MKLLFFRVVEAGKEGVMLCLCLQMFHVSFHVSFEVIMNTVQTTSCLILIFYFQLTSSHDYAGKIERRTKKNE